MRAIKGPDFSLWLKDTGGWRASLYIHSSLDRDGNSEEFGVSINMPVDNPDTSPAEIRKEIFRQLKKTLKAVVEWVEQNPVE